MAADPADPELEALLAAESPPRSYAEYVAELAAGGLVVSGPEEEFVIRDRHGSWRFRDAPVAGPRRGPRAPVLCFDWEPNGNVEVIMDAGRLFEAYQSNRIPWPFVDAS